MKTLALALAAALALAPARAAAQPAVPSHAPVRGEAQAPVTIVVFADFTSETAARAMIVLAGLRESRPERVRVAFRHHPAEASGPGMVDRAARAAHAQGRFWELHDLIFANQDRLTREDLIAMAEQIGLDVPQFTAALDADAADEVIRRDMEAATSLRLSAELALLVNGNPFEGALRLEALRAAVDAAK